ncbi:MAG: sulfite exporter TauE/SafE family protein [Planctomycetes bacterium]|nr:sulfite exporter TauE/SafE family protein [Planctomycetota bacterium]
MSISSLIWLCLASLAAGAVNSLAGGGTLLTFPALTAALAARGADEAKVWANATSTVALVPGAIAGAWGYRGEITHVRHWLNILAIPSLVGGVIGSLLLTRLPPHYFAVIVPWLLLAAAVIFLCDTIWGRARQPRPENKSHLATAGLMFFQFGVGVYGGYFGAGIGILMLSALATMGVGDIHQLNSLKTLLNACINGVSVVIFIASEKVEWTCALPMALAAIVGGYLGARLALRVPPRVVRWIVIAIGFGLAVIYFGR